MKIIDIISKETYYETEGGDTYEITAEAWERIKDGDFRYHVSEISRDMVLSIGSKLTLNDPEFEEKFLRVWQSTAGQEVLTGKRPIYSIVGI